MSFLSEIHQHTYQLLARHHLLLSIMPSDIEAYLEIEELVDDSKYREAYAKLELVGRKHALDGHERNPTSIAILKILCSTTGRLAEESGVTDKINLGFEFKKYLDRAIAVDPSSFELLHMRGRFSYKVANLSFFERLAARALGNLPQASIDAALEDLMELSRGNLIKNQPQASCVESSFWCILLIRRLQGLAEKVRPGVTENRLYIGRVLYAKGDYTAAKKWLIKAASATCGDDESVEREHITAAQEMLRLKVFQQ
ncbi:unnamed protein product [Angiostrongylus costaricensis]|uniref:TPR_REGION domain-containing protein n=1 Tax=Angiostrongylus costaricensis TaxID=334426 RepID=A0A0R3PCA6_ANGCS|nr:unnamed protein product [Angiostrongylus costaricensis]